MLDNQINGIIFRNNYISRVNIGLSLCALLLCMYFVFMFASGKEVDIDTSFKRKAAPAIGSAELVKKSEKYYERILTRRKLFAAQTGVLSGQKKDSIPNAAADLSLSQLQLLGIVSGAQGPQAIISNITNDRSFYCYGGENVEGFIVDQVKSDRVILKKDDEKFELRL